MQLRNFSFSHSLSFLVYLVNFIDDYSSIYNGKGIFKGNFSVSISLYLTYLSLFIFILFT